MKAKLKIEILTKKLAGKLPWGVIYRFSRRGFQNNEMLFARFGTRGDALLYVRLRREIMNNARASVR